MVVTCISNCAVLVIQLTSLASECHFPFGFYCSSIRQSFFVQYMKIINVEYFSNLFRLLSNFTHVAFSLNRLHCLGSKNHDKLTVFVSKLRIKFYLAFSLFVCAGLSVVKPLRYEINSLRSLEIPFPVSFDQNLYKFNWRFRKKYICILVFNLIFDAINYFGFFLVNLVIDIKLVVKLKQFIAEKEEKMENVLRENEKALEKSRKENEASKRRAVLMVVMNVCVNLLCKLPLSLSSLNDLRLHISLSQDINSFLSVSDWFDSSYWTQFFCPASRFCLLLQNLANFLYLVSMSLMVIFLKVFDLNFKAAWQNSFKKKKKNMVVQGLVFR